MLSFRNMLKEISEINFKDSLRLLNKCDVLLFCHDVDRGVDLDGKAYSPLLDSVREDLESRGFICQTVAHPWSVLVGNAGYGNPIAINRSYFCSLIKYKIYRIFKNKNASVSNRFLAQFYERIFELSKPRLIISIGTCDIMCSVARAHNIFHVELLHGIGYPFLPWGWGEKDVMSLPQGILSLDDVSEKSFSPLRDKKIDIKIIPHPFIKRFVGDKKKLHPCWVVDEGCSKVANVKQIIFSFSWGYAGDHGEYEQFAGILMNGLFPDVLAEVVNNTQDSVFWRFRFHPVQLKQMKYRYLMDFMDNFVAHNPNSEWRASSKMPYPALAALCDGNISMNSMSCYDAAYMGVPSLLLCPTVQPDGVFCDYFDDLVAQGYVVKKLASFNVIRDWVECVQKKHPLLGNLLNEFQWEEAVEWMLARSVLHGH